MNSFLSHDMSSYVPNGDSPCNSGEVCGDSECGLVCQEGTHCLQTAVVCVTLPESNPRDLWPLRHLIRVMTNQPTFLPTHLPTCLCASFREHPLGADLPTNQPTYLPRYLHTYLPIYICSVNFTPKNLLPLKHLIRVKKPKTKTWTTAFSEPRLLLTLCENWRNFWQQSFHSK